MDFRLKLCMNVPTFVHANSSICGYEGKENTNMHRNFVLFSKIFATSNIFHSITNVFDGLFSSKNETFEYRKHVLLFHGKKKEKGVTSNFFPFQRHSDFHEYRIHQSPRTFSEFYIPFCLSSLRKYENSLDSVTRANSSHAPRRGAFHPDDGGKMDRVCCRRAKKE